MNNREFRNYKDNYLAELKTSLESFLNCWIKEHDSDNDKKLNELVVDIYTNDYRRIKTLTYFPDYEKP